MSKLQVLKKICWFVVLAATSSDQVTLLNTTAADKKLHGLTDYKELLQTFITQEVHSFCPETIHIYTSMSRGIHKEESTPWHKACAHS